MINATLPMPELAGTRHDWIELDGVRIHVAELGPPDGQPILLVHGWPQNWWCWSRVAPLLADEFRCLMPDLRGHGWSSAPAGGYEKEQLADDMIMLLDAVGIDRVTYVGHDWGAFAGLLIGMRRPDRLSCLVATSIPHPWPSLRDRINPRRTLALAYQLPLCRPFIGPQLMRRGLTRQVLARANAGFTDRDLQIFNSTMTTQAGARSTTALYRTFLLDELPAIALGRYENVRLEVPMHLIVGERDPVARVRSTDTPRTRPGCGASACPALVTSCRRSGRS